MSKLILAALLSALPLVAYASTPQRMLVICGAQGCADGAPAGAADNRILVDPEHPVQQPLNSSLVPDDGRPLYARPHVQRPATASDVLLAMTPAEINAWVGALVARGVLSAARGKEILHR